jgi:hypothetical protein
VSRLFLVASSWRSSFPAFMLNSFSCPCAVLKSASAPFADSPAAVADSCVLATIASLTPSRKLLK